jgi:predicted anti-sigma-YlaC factor YlaD
VKQHSDIRSLLLPWVEHTLDQQSAQDVEEHLGECSSCKEYFEMMSAALSPSLLPKGGLSVDPFLPSRIRAHAEVSLHLSAKDQLVRWSLTTAVFAAAIVVGVYMGEKLSYRSTSVTDQRVISEYSDYLGGVGIGDRWQTVALVSEEVSE